ncbi:MarR family transcriptional regulator [Mycobacterium sp.]|uniref:MarR family transcriptional regulator n=1 Tax=Mycobacterium sp. TaxID=1785 RepID=UPI0039C8FA03
MTRRLEHAGFVRRSPSTEDKRAFLTEATPPVAACASRSGISGARSKKSVSAG